MAESTEVEVTAGAVEAGPVKVEETAERKAEEAAEETPLDP